MATRVLVVDAHADSRLWLAEALQLRDFQVSGVASGREAIDGHFEPDLVILELQMPDLDGYATLAELRKSSAPPPVIALSGHVLPDDERRVRDSGFDAALSKPVDLETLYRTVDEVLRGDGS
jgi:DNA-binding response OmpR family regulator